MIQYLDDQQHGNLNGHVQTITKEHHINLNLDDETYQHTQGTLDQNLNDETNVPMLRII